MRQVEREEVDLALHPADDADRLAEVGLGVRTRTRPSRMLRHQFMFHFVRFCVDPACTMGLSQSWIAETSSILTLSACQPPRPADIGVER